MGINAHAKVPMPTPVYCGVVGSDQSGRTCNAPCWSRRGCSRDPSWAASVVQSGARALWRHRWDLTCHETLSMCVCVGYFWLCTQGSLLVGLGARGSTGLAITGQVSSLSQLSSPRALLSCRTLSNPT